MAQRDTPVPHARHLQLVLVHSPRVGPSFWHPVASALSAIGVRAHTPQLPSLAMSYAPFWLAHAAAIANGLPEAADIVLAAHSGAGVLLPSIGRLARNRNAGTRIRGYLFVDCDLPRDGLSRFDLFADPTAADSLRNAARDGWLPRFTDRQLAPLLADATVRSRFLAEQPQLAVNVYEEAILVPDDWPEAPCAYLRLSGQYPDSVTHAQALGWLLTQIDAHHFLPLAEPARCATALASLAHALTDGGTHAPAT